MAGEEDRRKTDLKGRGAFERGMMGEEVVRNGMAGCGNSARGTVPSPQGTTWPMAGAPERTTKANNRQW